MSTLSEKWAAERIAAEEAQQVEAARQVAEQQQRQAEAERARLQALRDERLLVESYEGLSAEQKVEFDRLTNDSAAVIRLVEKARAEVEAGFNADNDAQRNTEFAAWRTKHLNASQWELHNGLEEVKKAHAERKAEWEKSRSERALQAEVHSDPAKRLVSSLDKAEKAVLTRLLNEQPSALQIIQGIQQGTEARAEAVRQVELRRAYEAELGPARGVSAKVIVKEKYRVLGLKGV